MLTWRRSRIRVLTGLVRIVASSSAAKAAPMQAIMEICVREDLRSSRDRLMETAEMRTSTFAAPAMGFK